LQAVIAKVARAMDRMVVVFMMMVGVGVGVAGRQNAAPLVCLGS